MARKPAHVPLDVYLNGRLVGQLRREPSGAVEFKYAAAWLAWENAIPVSLSLPLREDRYPGAPVLAVLDNLLPDDEIALNANPRPRSSSSKAEKGEDQ